MELLGGDEKNNDGGGQNDYRVPSSRVARIGVVGCHQQCTTTCIKLPARAKMASNNAKSEEIHNPTQELCSKALCPRILLQLQRTTLEAWPACTCSPARYTAAKDPCIPRSKQTTVFLGPGCAMSKEDGQIWATASWTGPPNYASSGCTGHDTQLRLWVPVHHGVLAYFDVPTAQRAHLYRDPIQVDSTNCRNFGKRTAQVNSALAGQGEGCGMPR